MPHSSPAFGLEGDKKQSTMQATTLQLVIPPAPACRGTCGSPPPKHTSHSSDRMPRPSLPPRYKPRQNEIQQQPDRPEEKRKHQARNHQQKRHVITPRIPHLPTPNKKIEGQIVNPSREHQPPVREQQHDVAKRVESSPMPTPVGEDKHKVKPAQQGRHQQTCYQRRNHPRRARRPSCNHQQNPTRQRRAIAKSKERIRVHAIPFLPLIKMRATAVSTTQTVNPAKDKLSGCTIDCPRNACHKISPKSAR